MAFDDPRERLRAAIRLSKETSATGQSMLDNPQGGELKAKAMAIAERALQLNDPDLVHNALDILSSLNAAEDEVRKAQDGLNAAEREGVQVMLETQDDDQK